MRCAVHAERDSVGECVSCGKPICDLCATPQGGGEVICKDCLANRAAEEIAGHQRKRPTKKAATQVGVTPSGLLARRARLVLILVCLVVISLRVSESVGLMQRPQDLRMGPYDTDAVTDECVEHLWWVAAKIQGGEMPRDIVCPASGKPYVLKDEDGVIKARCPNPEMHGFSEMVVTTEEPCPRLIR